MSADEGIEIFRVEAQELLEQIEQGLLDLAHNPDDKELVATVFRALHTLKGSGAMFGFDALADFTHHCETAFDRVCKGEVPATRELVTAVLNAMDHMRALAEGRAVAAAEGELLLAALEQVVSTAGAGSIAPPPGSAPALTEWHLRFTLAPDVLVNGTRPLPMLDELRALGTCRIAVITDHIPPLDELMPTECHLGWDVVLMTDQPRAAIEDVFMFVMDDMTLQIEAISQHNPASAAAKCPKTPLPEAELAKPARTPKPGGRMRSVPGSRHAARRADGPGGRAGDRAVAPKTNRRSQHRYESAFRGGGDRASRLGTARQHDVGAHGARGPALRPLPPPSSTTSPATRARKSSWITEGESTELDKP